MNIKILSRLRLPGMAMGGAEFEAKKRETEDATARGYRVRAKLLERCRVSEYVDDFSPPAQSIDGTVSALRVALTCIDALERRVRELEERR